MPELDRRIPFHGTFDDDELGRWAEAGSSPRDLASALREATRTRLLLLAIGGSHGDDVGRGLEMADVEAALRLASTPAEDRLARDAKRLALREHAADGIVGAMVRAALDHDDAELRPSVKRRAADGGRVEAPAPRRPIADEIRRL